MTPESEEFAELRRLLALKRHEQPPPGYFASFSDKVIARIEAEKHAVQMSWWRRLVTGVDLKPVLVCAYSLSVAGLIVVAFGLASSDDGTVAGMHPASTAALVDHAVTPVTVEPIAASAPVQARMTLQPMPTQDQSSSANSVLNPDAAPAGLFNPNGLYRPEQVKQTIVIESR